MSLFKRRAHCPCVGCCHPSKAPPVCPHTPLCHHQTQEKKRTLHFVGSRALHRTATSGGTSAPPHCAAAGCNNAAAAASRSASSGSGRGNARAQQQCCRGAAAIVYVGGRDRARPRVGCCLPLFVRRCRGTCVSRADGVEQCGSVGWQASVTNDARWAQQQARGSARASPVHFTKR